MRIGITYNLKKDYPSFLDSPRFSPEDAAEEWDEPQTVQAIQETLAGEGHEVYLLGGDLGAVEKIREYGVEFVFNIAEGYQGRSREAHIPALLEVLKIPYSGSDPLGLALTLDKVLTKRIASSLEIPTPGFWVLESLEETDSLPGRYPLFVKPAWEGSSKGIRFSSRVLNRQALAAEAGRLFRFYRGPVLVETYIAGREVTVGVLGNEPPEILGMMEIKLKDPAQKDFNYSLEVKRNWKELVEYDGDPALPESTKSRIREAALRLFKAIRLRDVARFDFRIDDQGHFYFLEVNPLPGLSPDSGDLVILARKKGWSYRDLILRILDAALSRYPSKSLKIQTEN